MSEAAGPMMREKGRIKQRRKHIQKVLPPSSLRTELHILRHMLGDRSRRKKRKGRALPGASLLLYKDNF